MPWSNKFDKSVPASCCCSEAMRCGGWRGRPKVNMPSSSSSSFLEEAEADVAVLLVLVDAVAAAERPLGVEDDATAPPEDLVVDD